MNGVRTPWLSTLERILPLIALVAIAAASLRIVSTYKVLSHTTDEPGHLACGLHYLEGSVCPFEYAPLARAAIAVGPYLAGVRPLGMTDMPREGLAVLAADYTRVLALARAGVLPFFWIACGGVYWWGRKCVGKAAAAMSVVFFSLLPPVLAHAGLATADMAETGFLPAAFLAWLIWTGKPTWGRSLLCGALTGLAVLAKFATCGFLPVILGMCLIWYVAAARPGQSELEAAFRARLARLCVVIVGAFVTWWAGFQFSLGSVAGIPLPAPQFFEALRYIADSNSQGQRSYLLGEVSDTGWWFYYPVALAFKTPIPFLLLFLVGCVFLAREGRWRNIGLMSPLIFVAGILLVGAFSQINIGVRHVLPVYCGMALVAGEGAILLAGSRKVWGTSIVAALLVWLIWAGAVQHPDYLAYFNELAGSEPEKVLVDSDLDWGQDFTRLARRLKALGVSEVHFSTWVPADLESVEGFPPLQPIDPMTPAPGWTAVSPTWWKLRQYESGLGPVEPEGSTWMDRTKPRERVGSLLLFYFPERN